MPRSCRPIGANHLSMTSGRSVRVLSSGTTAGIGIALILSACSGKNANLGERLDQRVAETRAEIEALNNSLSSTYDRESAITERLLEVEKINLQLRRDLERLRTQVATLMQEIESRPLPVEAEAPPKPTGPAGMYERAQASYKDHNYEEALAMFAEVIVMAPYGELTGNAQYWMGECHFGMEQWDAAVMQFRKVFAYANTAKADDAKLMMARCYRQMGDRDRARNTFQELLDEYPSSEYVETARKEMRILQ